VRIPRFFHDESLPSRQGVRIILTGPETHHISRVLRLRKGDHVELVNGKGWLCSCTLLETKAQMVTLEVNRTRILPDDRLPLKIYIGMLKGDKMDLVVQKVAEAGACSIQPVFTRYSIPRLDEKRLLTRLKRWNEIARQALKQSQGLYLTKVLYPVLMEQLWQRLEPDALRLVLWEGSNVSKDLFKMLKNWDCKGFLELFIGPEGGLSEQEVSLCEDLGFIPSSLGERILRAETACIGATVAILLYYNHRQRRK